ncbi:hypothetical protein MNBD_GAMMA24-267 [hydrothermal vent metagenome]|uniref:Uncharacterized protein n=1 Tax=hydrothermal vent metagenome TaxID=652676 RepID=A0A3B1C6H1_9ZZZZ
MVECFDIDPTRERETNVHYLFCHTRLEAEKIWKEQSNKSFYDNATRAYDLHQVINDGVDLVADFWFDDEDELIEEPLIRPTKISFGAECGGAYAWNEEGSCISIHHYFGDHPRADEIRQIDKEFEIWSAWYCDYYGNDDFPWDAFEAKERELAGKLADILADAEIEIRY